MALWTPARSPAGVARWLVPARLPLTEPHLASRPHRRRQGRHPDFQDALNEHQHSILVSLLQDARVTVPQELETELFAYYCAEVSAREPAFDRAAFAAAYADFGAQRNTRLLGLWLRLLKRDGKPHTCRTSRAPGGYLQRNARPSWAAGVMVRSAFPGDLRAAEAPG
jgi:hypothetical protein